MAAFKNIAIIFLLFVIAGAVSFCLSFQAPEIAAHNEHDGTTHGLMAHLSHATELGKATIGGVISLIVIALLVVAAVMGVDARATATEFKRQKRKHIIPAAEQEASGWRAIFERSPNAIKTT